MRIDHANSFLVVEVLPGHELDHRRFAGTGLADDVEVAEAVLVLQENLAPFAAEDVVAFLVGNFALDGLLHLRDHRAERLDNASVAGAFGLLQFLFELLARVRIVDVHIIRLEDLPHRLLRRQQFPFTSGAVA